MAPILKRKQPDSVLNRARKKFRSDQRGRGDPEQEPGLRTVSLESLQWHQVPFPATFQDAEGFFGLEELSDVDVVKDSSKIEYRVSSAPSNIASRTLTHLFSYLRTDPNPKTRKEGMIVMSSRLVLESMIKKLSIVMMNGKVLRVATQASKRSKKGHLDLKGLHLVARPMNI